MNCHNWSTYCTGVLGIPQKMYLHNGEIETLSRLSAANWGGLLSIHFSKYPSRKLSKHNVNTNTSSHAKPCNALKWLHTHMNGRHILGILFVPCRGGFYSHRRTTAKYWQELFWISLVMAFYALITWYTFATSLKPCICDVTI